MLIKICGITTLQEVEYLNEYKPDYAGFVFAKSKRQISKEVARDLVNHLDKDIKSVGVFKDNKIEEIIDVLNTVDLSVVQLHGDENQEYIDLLKQKISSKNIEIFKAISVKSKEDLEKLDHYKVDMFLLDGSNPGSGEKFNWDIISSNKIDKMFLLAGGINVDNVGEAIDTAKPYGVDLSSGVETVDDMGNPKKDKLKIKNIIEKVRL